MCSSDKRRILYIEGEPRWEYKFIRRAEDNDRIVQIVSMVRTSENKIYRQGIADPKELAEGFPNKVEDLFPYDGIVIGSVEASYFTPRNRELIKHFVDRRGGGLCCSEAAPHWRTAAGASPLGGSASGDLPES